MQMNGDFLQQLLARLQGGPRGTAVDPGSGGSYDDYVREWGGFGGNPNDPWSQPWKWGDTMPDGRPAPGAPGQPGTAPPSQPGGTATSAPPSPPGYEDWKKMLGSGVRYFRNRHGDSPEAFERWQQRRAGRDSGGASPGAPRGNVQIALPDEPVVSTRDLRGPTHTPGVGGPLPASEIGRTMEHRLPDGLSFDDINYGDRSWDGLMRANPGFADPMDGQVPGGTQTSVSDLKHPPNWRVQTGGDTDALRRILGGVIPGSIGPPPSGPIMADMVNLPPSDMGSIKVGPRLAPSSPTQTQSVRSMPSAPTRTGPPTRSKPSSPAQKRPPSGDVRNVTAEKRKRPKSGGY